MSLIVFKKQKLTQISLNERVNVLKKTGRGRSQSWTSQVAKSVSLSFWGFWVSSAHLLQIFFSFEDFLIFSMHFA